MVAIRASRVLLSGKPKWDKESGGTSEPRTDEKLRHTCLWAACCSSPFYAARVGLYERSSSWAVFDGILPPQALHLWFCIPDSYKFLCIVDSTKGGSCQEFPCFNSKCTVWNASNKTLSLLRCRDLLFLTRKGLLMNGVRHMLDTVKRRLAKLEPPRENHCLQTIGYQDTSGLYLISVGASLSDYPVLVSLREVRVFSWRSEPSKLPVRC